MEEGGEDEKGRITFANHALGSYRIVFRPPSGYTMDSPYESVMLTKQDNVVSVKKVLRKEEAEKEEEDKKDQGDEKEEEDKTGQEDGKEEADKTD